jgi:DNA-binding NtrC family response regulator
MMGPRGRLLVIDDKPNMRQLLSDILGPHHLVTVAVDGADARSKLEAQRFEVVLTDVRMPGMDGFEVLRLVKERWPGTEVVLITAFATVPAAVEAMREGAYDYVQKPFDPDDVTLVVARALERQRERASSSAAASHEGSLANLSYREALASARDRGSREYLKALLAAFGGNVSRAAERAGLERESLHRLMRRHAISADLFREPLDSQAGDE